MRRMLDALFASLLLGSPLGAATVTVDGSAGGRQQPIDGFGTCTGGADGSQAAFQQLYFDDMGCSMLRIDLSPSYISPYSDNQYNSPTWAQPGPNGNYTHPYTDAASYSASWNGHSAPIAVMGTDIAQNIAKLNWNDANVVGRVALAVAGRNRAAQLGGFKLFASVWSPPPWLKVSSGHSIGATFTGGPAAGTPWPFIWLGNYAGGKLDTSGAPNALFNDGTGATSALTQWARTIAAELKGYQDRTGVPFYAVSLQNELNFEEFYHSCSYQTSAEYIAMVKAVRAELNTHPELSAIKLMGPEDLMGSDAYAMWQYGGGSDVTHKNLQYLQNIAADPAAAAAIEMFCLHGYAPDGASAAGADPVSWGWWANGWTTAPALGVPANVKGFTAYGKKSWMTETSGEDPVWLSPSSGFPGNGAFSIALKLHQALTAGRESGWAYWQMGNDTATTTETLTDATTRQNAPKYVAAKHFFKCIRPGSVRLNAASSASDLLASAYVNDASGALTVVLVNSNASAQSATISLPSTPAIASFQAYTSSSASLWQTSTVGVSGGQATVTVPGYGVVTLAGTASAPPANVAPTVSLTSPAGGASYTAPAAIALAANASDSDGSVTKVEFYQGSTLIGTDTTSPWGLTWSNVAAGSYTLTAKAYDNSGAVTTSSAVGISVAAAPPPPTPNAAYVTQSVPTTMVAGQQYAVSVTMSDSGTTTWTAAGGYKLGAQNPQDNATWGSSRVLLNAGDSIAPGQSKTFAWTVTAPAAGTYHFQWRMVQEGVQWFGASSADVTVTVTNPPSSSGKARVFPRPGWGSRMVGGKLQGSSDGATYTDLATIASAPADGQWTDVGLTGTAYRYLRYLSPAGGYGNIAELEFYAADGTRIVGAGFGTPGSWSNAGNTFDKALDGNTATFVDAPDPGTGDYVGIDTAAGGAGTGLIGQYWSDQLATFSGAPSLTRTDATVDFDWGGGAPAANISADHFTARWTGQVQARATETYTFFVTGDDGVRLWVNGQLLIDRWIDQGPTEWSGAIALTAGQKYDLKLEYYENGGGAVARLAWSSPSTAKAIVPRSLLFPAAGTGLSATYWDNQDFTGATVARTDPGIDFDWGSGSPDAAIGPDTFSARWTGYLRPAVSGTYTFTTTSDDGTRLWIDGQLVIDNWTDHPPTANSGAIALTAGQLYPLRMDYYENGGGAVARLSWSSAATVSSGAPVSGASTALGPISTAELYPGDLSAAGSSSEKGGSAHCGLGGGFALLLALSGLRRRRG